VNDNRHLNFEKCALTSGLLSAQQLEEARLALRNGVDGRAPAGTTDQALSEKIVALGLLNAWQAKQLLDGRTKFTLGAYRIIDSLGQGGTNPEAGRRHQGPSSRQVDPGGNRQFYP